jgi:DNA-3-methyladenine glycosylase I
VQVALEKKRCGWATGDAAMVAYHDEEWGVPVRDDARLFEMLTLEGAQAGLSWRTILHKREGYRRAFEGFDAKKVARFDVRKIERLMHDEGIVRNRLKIDSTVSNARVLVALQKGGGSLSEVVWAAVGGSPKVNRPRTLAEVQAKTPESDALGKQLKKLGFRFVGSTVIYAMMQACGLVDDHVRACFRATARR